MVNWWILFCEEMSVFHWELIIPLWNKVHRKKKRNCISRERERYGVLDFLRLITPPPTPPHLHVKIIFWRISVSYSFNWQSTYNVIHVNDIDIVKTKQGEKQPWTWAIRSCFKWKNWELELIIAKFEIYILFMFNKLSQFGYIW